MLRRVGEELNTEGAKVIIGKANFPAPFKEGLEYSSPARGTWNIVHTGMMIPESHQIFVCALGCLRGVVLTAAEMNALDRYSSIQIREENVLDGGMEDLMIEGVTDVIYKLKYRPRAILLFISCQHFFLAYDQQLVFRTLRERFPDIKFTDCYMIPTLRKSGLTPDQKMRIQMYSMWEPRPVQKKKVNLIGSNLRTSPTSELVRMVEDAGYEFWDLYRCRTFDDYMNMAESGLNLAYEPMAIPAAKELEKRLGQKYLYLPFSFDFDELENNYQKLADALEIQKPDFTELKKRASEALMHVKDVIGDTPIAVDHTFTFRILSFTKMLLEYGFQVKEIYADAFLPEDESNFKWIQEHYPEIVISSTNRPKMRYLHHYDRENAKVRYLHYDKENDEPDTLWKDRNDTEPDTSWKDRNDAGADVLRKDRNDVGADVLWKDRNDAGMRAPGQSEKSTEPEKILAIGQKAAYFTETDYFVNVAESGGYYGFDGMIQIAHLMEDAFLNRKDRKTIIQKKGYGCESCI